VVELELWRRAEEGEDEKRVGGEAEHCMHLMNGRSSGACVEKRTRLKPCIGTRVLSAHARTAAARQPVERSGMRQSAAMGQQRGVRR
jgi:hypothetical protein